MSDFDINAAWGKPVAPHNGLSVDGQHRVMGQSCEFKETKKGTAYIENTWLVIDGPSQGEEVKQKHWYNSAYGYKQLHLEMDKIDLSLTLMATAAGAMVKYQELITGCTAVISQYTDTKLDGTKDYRVFFDTLESLADNGPAPVSVVKPKAKPAPAEEDDDTAPF